MLKAVLFDMDDTMLDINLTAFVTRYVADLSWILSQISQRNPAVFGLPFARAYLAMTDERRDDGLTNGALFAREFERRCGVPIADPTIRDALHFYERELLPKRGGGLVAARPKSGALAALEVVDELGLRTALATNPCFSEACIHCRMEWAHIADVPFERVSHMDNSTRLKPAARYYEEFVAALGLRADECLMVGNDARRDFARPDIGLRTVYVGHARPRQALWSGPMRELAAALPSIVERRNLEMAP